MANENSFDVASEVDLAEVANAVQQATKEVNTRYDLKDSRTAIHLDEKERSLTIVTLDEYKLTAVNEILQSKLFKRGISPKALTFGTIEPASGSMVRQKLTLQNGIPIEKAKEIVRLVKDSKKKAQASIQADVVRISSKDRDTLQEVIALLKGHDFGIDMQFTNFRS